ncbi:hypothetical protein BRADI_3g11042v3, partial [Brachypodium distachyon]
MGASSDRISSLPDDLIILILTHLGSAAAAARTSVLSRRWRRIWTHLPELFLNEPAATSDSIDAALAAAYSAGGTLRLLAITMPRDANAARVSPWLRFASQRLAGELSLDVNLRLTGATEPEEGSRKLELPPCERVTEMDVCFNYYTLGLPHDRISFPALAVLNMSCAKIEAQDLERLGSLPRLRELVLRGITLATVYDVSIRSDTLERLIYLVSRTRRLEIVAPKLQALRTYSSSGPDHEIAEAYVVAPSLADLAWFFYDPQRHRFVGAGRHLRKLSLLDSSTTALMQRFDTADELEIKLSMDWVREGYENFMNAMSKPTKCKVLDLQLRYRGLPSHFHAPCVLYLLKKSSGLRRIVVHLPLGNMVVIMNFEEGNNHVEFLSLLLGCNTPILKTVVINSETRALSKDTCIKIRSNASPIIDV